MKVYNGHVATKPYPAPYAKVKPTPAARKKPVVSPKPSRYAPARPSTAKTQVNRTSCPCPLPRTKYPTATRTGQHLPQKPRKPVAPQKARSAVVPHKACPPCPPCRPTQSRKLPPSSAPRQWYPPAADAADPLGIYKHGVISASTSARPEREAGLIQCALEHAAKKVGGKAGSAIAVALVRRAMPAVSRAADAGMKRLDDYIDKSGC